MKKKIILLIVVIAAISGYFYYEKQQQALQMADPVLYGNVDVRSINLAFLQAGRLDKMLVDEGDKVIKGELLAQLDTASFVNALEIAKANLNLAKAQLAEVLSGSRSQDIEAAHQDIIRLQAKLALANSTLQRQQRLRKTGATSQGALDNAQALYNEAMAELASAKQKFSLLKEGADKEDIAIAYAQIDIVQAQVNSAQTTLDETKLYAPNDALVQTRILEPGSIAGMNIPVLSLSVRTPIYIRAYVSESLLGKISLGQKMEVYTDSREDAYQGHIGFISGTAEFTPKTVETASLRTDLVYRLRIIVDGDDVGLNQGQPVTIKLHKMANDDG
jgi:HlyD family secretion protein